MKKVIFSDTVDNVLNIGISLESIGVNNWALSRRDALQALSHFVELQIPILGGDVCEFFNEVIRYNYDSWYCERKINETLLDYVERSAREVKNYIEHYPDKVVYFSLVPGMNINSLNQLDRQMKAIKFINNPLSHNPETTFVAHLSDINSKDQLFKELSNKLRFPEYFGDNWDALSDCLRDFNWIDQEGIVLVHDDMSKLDETTLDMYIRSLAEAVRDWKEGEDHYLEIVFSEKDEGVVRKYLEKA